jgi:predicted O-methyltransferase YrrM
MKPMTVRDMLDLLEGSVPAAALGAALELRLFELLETAPRDAEEVSRALGIPACRCRAWLDVLVGAGVLEEEERGFVPSAAAQATVLASYDPAAWALLAEESRHRLPALCDLPRRLRDTGRGAPHPTPGPPAYVAAMAADPALARRFTRMLAAVHRSFAARVAAALDLSGVERLVDLGGGSGVVAMAIARRSPGIAATVVDIPTVCDAGREIVGEAGLSDRIAFHPAEFLRDDLPAPFDLALLCDVNVFDDALFRKVHAALHPGGRLVIVDQFAPAAGIAPPARRHWVLESALAGEPFAYPTVDAVSGQLTRAGFGAPRVAPLPAGADEDSPFDRGFLVIEARRVSYPVAQS